MGWNIEDLKNSNFFFLSQSHRGTKSKIPARRSREEFSPRRKQKPTKKVIKFIFPFAFLLGLRQTLLKTGSFSDSFPKTFAPFTCFVPL
ncbi:MAG TPA: hypothetical protein DCZ94_20710 [Lentisphaeria bacterium]|nr:MAG: hypothetical protein A2X48_09140 [Lentisphaerae bacterium GWF2_49_21]HBC89369.1 hypothetical protein [Lentisphaeria bacterium]